MYQFIKNPFTISILLGALFAVAFSSGSFIFNNISFAQKATTPSSTDNSFDSSTIPTTTTTNTTTTASNGAQNQPAAASNKMVQFNHYENNEIGISLKYPSNFLIDESNSNNTLRQISFYPTNSAPISSFPEQYILWMDVFVQNPGNQQQQHPLLSLSQRLSSSLSSSSQVSNPDLASYSINLANSIQQANKDVSIIGSYPNVTLSGYPAYKLITKSFIGNTAIIDVLISAAVNNTIYSVDFQTNSSNYPNSISNTNKIIQSFKIMSPVSLASATTTTTMNPSLPSSQPPLSSSSSSSSLSQSSAPPASTSPNSPSSPSSQQSENSKTKPSSSALIPSLSNILSDLQLNDIANNSTHLLKTLKNTVTNSMSDVLSNPQNALDNSIKGTTSLIPTTPSELTSLPSTALKKACGLPFVSGVCSEIGKSVINKDQNPNLEKSVDNGSANNTSSNNSISNNAAAVNRGNEGIGNGTIAGANVNREAGIGNGESSINNGGISDNNKRNSLITSLESLFSANTNNNTNQSSLSSNSSALGSGLSFLEKLILHLTPSTLISKTPNTTSSVPIISSLNSSMLAATTDMANQSNSTFANPSSSSSSSSPAPSSQQQSPSTYIPPPIH